MKRACQNLTHLSVDRHDKGLAKNYSQPAFPTTSLTLAFNKIAFKHTKLISLIIVLSISLSSFSQYTEVINSKRPGFAESPFAVGSKVYQIEGGLFYQRNDNPNFFTKKKSLGMDLFLRSGFISEKLEINANFKLQKDNVLNNVVTGSTYDIGGISQFTIGAKYLFYMPKYKDPSKEIRSWKAKLAFDWKRLIPSVGFYAGLNTNLLSSDYKGPSLSPKAVILLQNDFSQDLILVTNFVGDHLTIKENRTLGYITTLTYSISPNFSMFGEHQGMFTRYTKYYEVGGGLAYLFNKDFQLGLNLRTDSQFDYLNIYGGLGLSYRIDRHKDKVIRTKSSNEGSGKVQEKEGIFKRLFKKKSRRGKAPRKRKYRKTRTRSKEKTREPRTKRDRRKRD